MYPHSYETQEAKYERAISALGDLYRFARERIKPGDDGYAHVHFAELVLLDDADERMRNGFAAALEITEQAISPTPCDSSYTVRGCDVLTVPGGGLFCECATQEQAYKVAFTLNMLASRPPLERKLKLFEEPKYNHAKALDYAERMELPTEFPL